MDLRLITWYAAVVFFLSLEGRCITSAAIMNVDDGTDIKHQLGDLTSEQWALVLSVASYPYLVLHPVSTLLLKKFSPRIWLSGTMLVWGVIATCQGAVTSFDQLIACRLLLGVAESAFIPAGLLYHLSFWYPASSLAFRIACIAAAAALAGAFSGLLAFAVSFMDGTAGLAGWRWLFVLMGIPLLFCGLITAISLPNYPDDAEFLSSTQKDLVLDALPSTQPSATDDTWNWQQIKDCFKDPTTYTFFLIWMFNTIGTKGVTLALPTVLEGLGITSAPTTQLLTMPPYLVGASILLATAWLIDKKRLNCWPTSIVLGSFCCVCYIILLTVDNPVTKYIFIITALTASFAIVPILWPERIRAAHGTTRAALCIGTTTVAPVFFGIVGPQIWQPAFGPDFEVSYGISLALIVSAVVCILWTWFMVRQRDRKAAVVQSHSLELMSSDKRHDSAIVSEAGTKDAALETVKESKDVDGEKRHVASPVPTPESEPFDKTLVESDRVDLDLILAHAQLHTPHISGLKQ